MMKPLKIALLITTIFISNSVIAQPKPQTSPNPQTEIIGLIKDLARLTDMADACGEHMNYFGKKALEGEVCKEFTTAFYSKWSSREALQQMVDDYMIRIEQGELNCENCRMMLQRAEELRITIAYYLDYMEFMSTF